jgi:hypothetical protein
LIAIEIGKRMGIKVLSENEKAIREKSRGN